MLLIYVSTSVAVVVVVVGIVVTAVVVTIHYREVRFWWVLKISNSDLVSSRLSVPFRPSVCIEDRGSHWTYFSKIWFFRKFAKKI
jgi:hypothetical protein